MILIIIFQDNKLIIDFFNNVFDNYGVENMLENLKEKWLNVFFKIKNENYIITAGNNDYTYIITFEVLENKKFKKLK